MIQLERPPVSYSTGGKSSNVVIDCPGSSSVSARSFCWVHHISLLITLVITKPQT